MNVRNRFVSKIETDKSEIEATIEIKLDEIKAYHIKTINSLEKNISYHIKNYSLSSEEPPADIVK